MVTNASTDSAKVTYPRNLLVFALAAGRMSLRRLPYPVSSAPSGGGDAFSTAFATMRCAFA